MGGGGCLRFAASAVHSVPCIVRVGGPSIGSRIGAAQGRDRTTDTAIFSRNSAKPPPGGVGNRILQLRNVKMSMRYTWRGG
jgi:hypothetical protein